MMKRVSYSVFLGGLTMLGLASACGRSSEGFTLRGEMKGMPDSVKVSLLNVENAEAEKICEGWIVNETFTLTGKVNYPMLCTLDFHQYSDKRKQYIRAASVRTMVDNVEMTVRSDVPVDSLWNMFKFEKENRISVQGGKVADEWNRYHAQLHEAERKADLASYKGASMYFESNGNPDTVSKYDALTKQAEAELLAARLRFVEKHPAYHVSAYLVIQEMRKPFAHSADELKRMAGWVQSCPDTARVNRVNRVLDWALRYAIKEAYTDFEATTPEGKVAKLSDYLKPDVYMLIDFWASWCGPCRAAIPRVEQLYKQYNGKLNVCSVSVDEKEEAWHKAMADEQMPWVQLWLTGEQQQKALQAYFVEAIPRLVLIDGKGEVVCVTNKPADVEEYLKNAMN